MSLKQYDKDQNFLFTIELVATVRGKNYDNTMRQIIDEINKVNNSNIIIKKIEGSHPIAVI